MLARNGSRKGFFCVCLLLFLKDEADLSIIIPKGKRITEKERLGFGSSWWVLGQSLGGEGIKSAGGVTALELRRTSHSKK